MCQQEVQVWYLDHHHWLYAWLRKKLGCPHHAADVAQNTFMKLLIGHVQPSEIMQPRAWLTTTAQRLIVDEFRRKQIEQTYLDELSRSQAVNCDYPSPDQILMAVDALAQLAALLDAAAPKARTAFVRHYIDGHTQTTVAQELGISTKMVQKYLVQVLVRINEVGIRI